ncbi:MAG: glycosyltransferase family 2 protein [Paludibacteraceae bacterium]|nr:glycosyltransferase family 2 protein [Paludibacteraceae bacterium]
MKKLISILIPCYNEAQSLPILIPKLEDLANNLKQYEWEFLCVNDGSKDNTLEVLRELRVVYNRINYIDLSRNYGKENAMLAGFDYVKGDCMVIMDADLQHPPHVIVQMLEKWEEGNDDVYASRLTRGKESWLRKKLSLLYYRILQRSTRLEVLPNVGDFRLLDRRCINALKQMRENNRYTKGMYCYIGFRKTYVTFETEDRIAGESSMNYKTLINLAIEGILSYTTLPLRIATVIGVLTSLFAFIYMLVVFIKTLLYGDPVQGYPTMMIVILFLGGIQLLALGILGEYIGRIFTETKNRPVYFVRTYNDEQI